MLRRVFSVSMALSSSVMFARFSWAYRMPSSLSGVQNVEDFLSAAVNVARSLHTVSSVFPGASVGDATWDALSSSVSCFEPFLVILQVACDRAMVNVFVLSSVFMIGLSKFAQYVDWMELSSCFFKKVFCQSRVCVTRSIKVFGSDKLIN